MPLSPSPSPPPTAPDSVTNPNTDATTPLEPGTRALQFRKIYASALAASLKSNSYPNFASCFPTPARYCPTALEGVWKQLNARLEEECQKDFEKILDERKVVAGLNGWDDVLELARRRRDRAVDADVNEDGDVEMTNADADKAGVVVTGASHVKPVHMLDARELHEAFMYKYLVRVMGELDEKLGSTQRDNQDVMGKIQQQREELQRLIGGIEGLVRDVEGAVRTLEEEDQNGKNVVDGLKSETWDMHQEVKAAK